MFRAVGLHFENKYEKLVHLVGYYYKKLVGVPGVARDDQWQNQMEFFLLYYQRERIICGRVSV
jgi:hypothetical protein